MDKLGLIAGSGRFPLLVTQEAKRMGVEIVALGIKGVTVRYFKLGQLSAPIAAFKEAGVSKAVMAGKVQHASLFGGVMPDVRAAKLLMRVKDKRTDTILRAVADEFAKDGIELIASTSYLSHLIVKEGVITSRAPDSAEMSDIGLGFRAAKAVAGFDIGQTVVVKDGAVIAVEGMEGTDACVLRAAVIARSQGKNPALTVVKVAKPNQDMRFDVPIIGLDSLKVFAEAGVSALAVQAGSTMIFDYDEFVKRANSQNLAVTGLNERL
jgi:DUF1009 family protein